MAVGSAYDALDTHAAVGVGVFDVLLFDPSPVIGFSEVGHRLVPERAAAGSLQRDALKALGEMHPLVCAARKTRSGLLTTLRPLLQPNRSSEGPLCRPPRVSSLRRPMAASNVARA